MALPDNTKYQVARALRNMISAHLVDALPSTDFDLEEMRVTVVQPLVLTIRLKPRAGYPRYITVQVSERQ